MKKIRIQRGRPLSLYAKRSTLSAGFTLIEVMLVVIIIGIMAAIVMPRLGGRSEQARVARAKADLANISVALGLCELDTGSYPDSLDGLVTNSGSNGEWKGPYLDDAPTDPWGHPYEYQAPGQHNPNKFDLYSFGKDGVASDDDVANWKK